MRSGSAVARVVATTFIISAGAVFFPRPPSLARRDTRGTPPPLAPPARAPAFENPAPRRADAARFRDGIGQRVPRPERDELLDRLLHPCGIELPDDTGNVGALRVQGCGGEEEGDRDEDSAHGAIVSERYSGGTR